MEPTDSPRSPTNTNYLSPLGFEFVLARTPTVVYFCNQVMLPTLTIPEIRADNPLITDNYPGDKMMFEELSMKFKVDEDMGNYLEMFRWIQGLGFPERSEQYADIVNGTYPNGAVQEALSDGTLLIQTSHRKPNIRVFFKRLFPINLSQLSFDTTQQNLAYLECDISFKFSSFTMESV